MCIEIILYRDREKCSHCFPPIWGHKWNFIYFLINLIYFQNFCYFHSENKVGHSYQGKHRRETWLVWRLSSRPRFSLSVATVKVQQHLPRPKGPLPGGVSRCSERKPSGTDIQGCCLHLTHSKGKPPRGGPSGNSLQAVAHQPGCEAPCQAEGDFFLSMEMTFGFSFLSSYYHLTIQGGAALEFQPWEPFSRLWVRHRAKFGGHWIRQM